MIINRLGCYDEEWRLFWLFTTSRMFFLMSSHVTDENMTGIAWEVQVNRLAMAVL